MFKKPIKTIRELYKRKTKWTQGAYASDIESGNEVEEDNVSDAACDIASHCFCLSGAVIKIYGDVYRSEVEAKLA
jgi:hypothetical protein